MNQQTPSLRIGLLENCYHSLKRGYELWGEGQRKQDAWLLKEAIIWIHHGIELGIKQLLVQTNEYLVFEDVDKAVKQLTNLRKQNPAVSVLDLFEQENPAFSVSFHKAVERAAVMLNLDDLSERSKLRTNIDELTKYRNKIVHYSISIDFDRIVVLLSETMNDFLGLLETTIKDDNFSNIYIKEIRQASLPLTQRFLLLEKEAITRIENLMNYFNCQKVPGYLFGANEDITLPKFKSINQAFKPQLENRRFYLDIKAETENKEVWIVEVKLSSMLPSGYYDSFSKLTYLKSKFMAIKEELNISDVKNWFVSLNERSSLFSMMKVLENNFQENEFLVSSLSEIKKLEELFEH
jgi:hypothetical protein